MKTVFLSYARNDAHFAEEIERAFRPGGFRAWRFQSDMVGGKPWNPQLPFNIEACDIFLLATTDNSLDSETCEKEWQHAALKQKPMVTVVFERGVFPPAPLDDHQWVTFDDTAVSGAGLINALQNAQPLRWDMIPEDWRTWDGKTKAEPIGKEVVFADIPIPAIHEGLADLDKEEFVYTALPTIREYFQRAVVELGDAVPRMSGKVREESASKFTCTIYRDRNAYKRCEVWAGNILGEFGIAYSEASGQMANYGVQGVNELAVVTLDKGTPALEFKYIHHSYGNERGCQICTLKRACEQFWRFFTRDFEEESSFWK